MFYVISQAFNFLWAEQTLLDCFDNGISNNLLNVMHDMSKRAKIHIKTPVGIAYSEEIHDTIMHGELVSSIFLHKLNG